MSPNAKLRKQYLKDAEASLSRSFRLCHTKAQCRAAARVMVDQLLARARQVLAVVPEDVTE